MKQPITYIPAGIVVGILLAGIIGLINKITKKKMGFRKLLGIWLLCIYRSWAFFHLGCYLAGTCLCDRKCDHVSAAGNSDSHVRQTSCTFPGNIIYKCCFIHTYWERPAFYRKRILSAGWCSDECSWRLSGVCDLSAGKLVVQEKLKNFLDNQFFWIYTLIIKIF